MTVDQYREIPSQRDVQQELHWGQLVTLTRPKARQIKLQSRLVRLLRPMAERLGYVESELPFRALPEYDLRAADVAFISQQRWDETGDDDDLAGAPEIVIEVVSPSNTMTALKELAALCLSAGTMEFWIVNPQNRTISVTRRGSTTVLYREGESIEIELFGAAVAVSQVFASRR